MKPIIYTYMDTYYHAKKLFYALYKPSSPHKGSSCNEEDWENGEWLEVETMFEVWRIVKNPQSTQLKWIPISEDEELPKVADCYAVTEKIGNDLITKACFFEKPNIWHNDIRINRERNCLTNIVAWMPLPEAYREDNENV